MRKRLWKRSQVLRCYRDVFVGSHATPCASEEKKNRERTDEKKRKKKSSMREAEVNAHTLLNARHRKFVSDRYRCRLNVKKVRVGLGRSRVDDLRECRERSSDYDSPPSPVKKKNCRRFNARRAFQFAPPLFFFFLPEKKR